MCGMLKNPHCCMAVVPSIGKNLQPFTANGDVSIWVKNSRMGRKPPNKQTNKSPNSLLCTLVYNVNVYISIIWRKENQTCIRYDAEEDIFRSMIIVCFRGANQQPKWWIVCHYNQYGWKWQQGKHWFYHIVRKFTFHTSTCH